MFSAFIRSGVSSCRSCAYGNVTECSGDGSDGRCLESYENAEIDNTGRGGIGCLGKSCGCVGLPLIGCIGNSIDIVVCGEAVLEIEVIAVCGYSCTRCDGCIIFKIFVNDLENENGQSGRIVLEDLSDETNYISGYWNRDELVFEIFVVLKTAEEDILTELKVTNTPVYETGIASIAKADVEKCAADEGVTGSYEVTFSFIPKNASVNTAYNITFE